jgi:hypothetical protein
MNLSLARIEKPGLGTFDFGRSSGWRAALSAIPPSSAAVPEGGGGASPPAPPPSEAPLPAWTPVAEPTFVFPQLTAPFACPVGDGTYDLINASGMLIAARVSPPLGPGTVILPQGDARCVAIAPARPKEEKKKEAE